ncbi:unnamed protein product [Bursaphelenchus okinawaensis]|uniref:Uncharacterized protein n=1 Tax=Bursaphelenchus okinawaensis TaxID=465554 RepID=A0A811KB10_9BILA|nr:unnamed protein product [Bursaphelenchus okinawaensis]CAG9095978.1 unnamed protein product [Bursaphelenchus okinawaensis]
MSLIKAIDVLPKKIRNKWNDSITPSDVVHFTEPVDSAEKNVWPKSESPSLSKRFWNKTVYLSAKRMIWNSEHSYELRPTVSDKLRDIFEENGISEDIFYMRLRTAHIKVKKGKYRLAGTEFISQEETDYLLDVWMGYDNYPRGITRLLKNCVNKLRISWRQRYRMPNNTIHAFVDKDEYVYGLIKDTEPTVFSKNLNDESKEVCKKLEGVTFYNKDCKVCADYEHVVLVNSENKLGYINLKTAEYKEVKDENCIVPFKIYKFDQHILLFSVEQQIVVLNQGMKVEYKVEISNCPYMFGTSSMKMVVFTERDQRTVNVMYTENDQLKVRRILKYKNEIRYITVKTPYVFSIHADNDDYYYMKAPQDGPLFVGRKTLSTSCANDSGSVDTPIVTVFPANDNDSGSCTCDFFEALEF